MKSPSGSHPKPPGPANATRSPRILFVTPDAELAERLQADPRSVLVPPLIAHTGREALALIQNDEVAIAAILVSPDVNNPSAISVLRAAHQARSHIPLFLIGPPGQETKAFDEKELKRLGVLGSYAPEQPYEELLRELCPPSATLDPREILAKSARTDSAQTGHSVDPADSEFFSIRADTFVGGKVSVFDAYLRMDNGRYIKIVKSGDDFSPERLAAYLKKGVRNLYLRSDLRHEYLAYCDRVTFALAGRPDVDPQLRVEHLLNQGEKTIELLRDRLAAEIAPEQGQFVGAYLQNLSTTIVDMTESQSSRVLDLLYRDAHALEHSVAVATVAALLARALDFDSEKSIRVIGMAALFHDIGLVNLPPAAQSEDLSKMTPEEQKAYKLHPIRSAQILESLRGVDPVAVQAVSHHHRRRDGEGFPNQVGMGVAQFSLPAEIIGICDALLCTLRDFGPADIEGRDLRLHSRVFTGYGPQVTAALRGLLGAR